MPGTFERGEDQQDNKPNQRANHDLPRGPAKKSAYILRNDHSGRCNHWQHHQSHRQPEKHAQLGRCAPGSKDWSHDHHRSDAAEHQEEGFPHRWCLRKQIHVSILVVVLPSECRQRNEQVCDVGDQTVEHPRAENCAGYEHREDLRDKRQRHLIDLGDRLKD